LGAKAPQKIYKNKYKGKIMISDVLSDSITDIEKYLQKEPNYQSASEIKALVTLMRSIQHDLDISQCRPRILNLKTFFEEWKAIGILIRYLLGKIKNTIFRKKDITYSRLKE
jgi:hypothetical protein